MMKKRLPFFKRAQRGQTIVILALAFIVLLGFVGIVTDISLMFVRYNTLRRAVDSAAVAAAGQVRRTLPNAQEIANANAMGGTQAEKDKRADGFAFARNIATVNLAARQFIEFYGLSPSTVLVDTCATTPADPELKCSIKDPVTGKLPPPRKLVRVTAQLNSPTVFLRLLGWPSVLLEATSISETAVLDVVMIFDSSESMLNQTSYDDWEKGTPYKMHYYAPRMAQPAGSGVTTNCTTPSKYDPVYLRMFGCNYDYMSAWYQTLGKTQNQITADTTTYPVISYLSDASNNITIINDPNDSRQAPPNCRVRFFPAAETIVGGVSNGQGANAPTDDVRVEYTKLLKQVGYMSSGGSFTSNYDGFVPAYNYFGCCNDPNQDGKFEDLVCQPFKAMRDSTAEFLKHIDFTRGDRVAYVTFDRYAYLIDPDGQKGGADGTGPQTPMMTSQSDALLALSNEIGVRAETSFYADTVINGTNTVGTDGLWDSYVIGGAPYNPSDPSKSGTPIRYEQTMTNLAAGTWSPSGTGGYNNTTVGQLNDYPVNNNCHFQNAGLQAPFSIYSSLSPLDADLRNVNYIASRYPTPMAAFGQPKGLFPGTKSPNNGSTTNWPNPASFISWPATLMLPNLNDPAWNNQLPVTQFTSPTDPNYARQGKKPQWSYEIGAGCGSSNVGAALRVGNNALLNPNTVRTNGAVWVMVMLGDGAAAQSDPVRRGGAAGILNPGNPYGDPNSAPTSAGQYGSYGLCPYGTPANPGALLDNNFDVEQPRCSDMLPETRNPYCFRPDPGHTDADSNIFIDLNDDIRCETTYDVDDYARDWADYVGLSNPFPELTTQGTTRNALQLPTIFTIGFGIDFQQGNHSCAANVSDCLGEELLRYIADVGDNQRIDTDYQQDLKRDGVLDGKLSNNDPYGDRGPCEGPVVGYGSADAAKNANDFSTGVWVNPLPPKTNCGNYYNAPDPNRLTAVFDDIASRMFTRLTR